MVLYGLFKYKNPISHDDSGSDTQADKAAVVASTISRLKMIVVFSISKSN